jgi:hypothetical protein
MRALYGLGLIIFLSLGLGQKLERDPLNQILKQGVAAGRDVSAWARENVFVRADRPRDGKR